MFDLSNIVDGAIGKFLSNFFDQIISYFATTLANIMGTSLNVLQVPLVQNGIYYAQSLAFTILVIKSMNEAFQTYILYQSGDPDADPTGLLIRIGQAVAIISALPWIIVHLFTFGSKVAIDVSNLSSGQMGITDWSFMSTIIISSGGTVIVLFAIILAIMLLVVAIQATIRGAELALMAFIGPIMALNITANNRSIWSAWFKQVIIICTAQALQIFLLKGALSFFTNQSITSNGLLLVFGWLWVTVKSPKFIQQIAYSTGFTGAVGGTVKQAGTFVLMRRMMAK